MTVCTFRRNVHSIHDQAASTHAIFLAHASRIVQIASPGQPQRAALKIAVGEHIGQTKVVVIGLGEQLQVFFHAVVAQELVVGRVSVGVHFEAFDDEVDVVRLGVVIKI